jgi:hypothetical protein
VMRARADSRSRLGHGLRARGLHLLAAALDPAGSAAARARRNARPAG